MHRAAYTVLHDWTNRAVPLTVRRSSKSRAFLWSSRDYSVVPPPRDRAEKEMIDRILRVDHAGEYGANRIYAGQMAVLGRSHTGTLIQEMWDQEKKHLEKFNEILAESRVRPTALLPLWNVAGYLLGASTAMLGKEVAMACTVAVEESISEHYNSQIRTLMEKDPDRYTELLKVLKEFRDDEMEHHDIGLEHDAESVPGYWLLKNAIQLGCKAAIYASQHV
ncbi:5-demethoxyubiquinone hydroxylase, mitochondrial isoform X1 [Phyllopteryx taeniolatus]|uniref:5-demethoxyubiquinone hydroxylase, mitochondrial isoform X1 n=1 Tax=Phycodurus eques TaxID=693459 RepID=UPI002ACD567F|nr:5-demethoxyubiquinone hydroxylase, mitochondrial isoform X1 [Phycodurus eques]XP_061625732.1 5-demethoxyubiquinone hydroxylase, mitochondrial isoform X1 [Phyllopteryx taeniolatus]